MIQLQTERLQLNKRKVSRCLSTHICTSKVLESNFLISLVSCADATLHHCIMHNSLCSGIIAFHFRGRVTFIKMPLRLLARHEKGCVLIGQVAVTKEKTESIERV